MRKIEASVEFNELVGLRDSLRKVGVKTIRVTGLNENGVPAERTGVDSSPAGGDRPRSRARVGVVVPDDIADRVILIFLGMMESDHVCDAHSAASSIEHVVRLEFS